LAQAKNGDWIEFSFAIESAPSQKLVGMQLDDSPTPPTEKATIVAATMNRAEFIKTVGSYVDRQIAEDRFSGVVMVAKGDNVLYSKAAGLADEERKIPNNIDTKFNLGSINKIFTKIAIGQLIAAGKISPDDKL